MLPGKTEAIQGKFVEFIPPPPRDGLNDYFREKNVLTFGLTPGVEGVCKDRMCACMVLCVPLPLI